MVVSLIEHLSTAIEGSMGRARSEAWPLAHPTLGTHVLAHLGSALTFLGSGCLLPRSCTKKLDCT
jgi:hypothetical protein